jgi:hypothetical protein
MSSLYNGTWEIDLDHSLVWDDVSRQHVRDEVGQEIITLRINGDVQDYEVLYGDRPKVRMGYTARYDDTQWVSYAVREVISDSADVDQEVNEFKQRIKAAGGDRDRSFEVGTSSGICRCLLALSGQQEPERWDGSIYYASAHGRRRAILPGDGS